VQIEEAKEKVNAKQARGGSLLKISARKNVPRKERVEGEM